MPIFNNAFDFTFSGFNEKSIVTDNNDDKLKEPVIGESQKQRERKFIVEQILQPTYKEDTGIDAPPMLDVPSMEVLSKVMNTYGINALLYLRDSGFDMKAFNETYGSLDLVTANKSDVEAGNFIGGTTDYVEPSDNVNQFISNDLRETETKIDNTKEQQSTEDVATASILGTNIKPSLIYAGFAVAAILLILNNKWGK